jgi:rhamnogalacturonan endolyase
MEFLERGVVAIGRGDGGVLVTWRLLASDSDAVAFNVYRVAGKRQAVKLNDQPLIGKSNLLDAAPPPDEDLAYFVRPLVAGKEQPPSAPYHLAANRRSLPYRSVALQTPPGCTPGDASVGDLDGDGEYEIVLKQEERGRDNSQRGRTGQTKLEAYRLDGTLLWRIDLGRNIREGAHYTQFMVYDLDGDGRAELACKTAAGTVDGAGRVIGDATADYRNEQGYILEGPEYLTVFDGRSGMALASADYQPPRGKVGDWGDDYGNRVDRFLASIAYLDGRRPSLVMCRGYYTRAVLAAWNWRDGKLTRVWTFDSDAGGEANRDYRGQGNHNLAVGDVDGDGRDEIVYGACAIDDDGRGLYSTKLGHGDALHLADIDPDRPGLEVFDIHERPRHDYGIELHDAASGQVIWGAASPDVSRGVAMDIDPRHRGYECWAAGRGLDALYSCRGEKIAEQRPRSCNMGVWWDGDALRELLDGATISKWDHENQQQQPLLSARDFQCASNNGSKANPCLCADICGDWREEVIWRTSDNRELRIFTSSEPTEISLPTMMHDPVYRLSVAWQNVAYNQPTQTSFYLGDGMSTPPKIEIETPRYDANRPIRVERLRSPHQQGETEIDVLPPTSLETNRRYPVVYVLPVEASREHRYGNGMREIERLGLHDKHQAIFVAPTFSHLPWYADHPDKPELRQERYFLESVLPLVEENYPARHDAEGRLLLGFSKSGWGAWSLLLRHPEKFARAAAWDAPLMMDAPGKYGSGPIFGTAENFGHYQLSRLVRKRGAQLGSAPRLLLSGYGNFRAEHQAMHQLLDELNIAHVYLDGPKRNHDWHSGWVAAAVEFLLPLGKESAIVRPP